MEDCLVREANGRTFFKSSEERESSIAILSILYPTISGTQLVTAGSGCFDCIFKCFNLLYSDYLVLQNGIMFVVIISSAFCTKLSHNMSTNSDTMSVTLEWHWGEGSAKSLDQRYSSIFFHSILTTKIKHPINLSHFLIVIIFCSWSQIFFWVNQFACGSERGDTLTVICTSLHIK